MDCFIKRMVFFGGGFDCISKTEYLLGYYSMLEVFITFSLERSDLLNLMIVYSVSFISNKAVFRAVSRGLHCLCLLPDVSSVTMTDIFSGAGTQITNIRKRVQILFCPVEALIFVISHFQ